MRLWYNANMVRRPKNNKIKSTEPDYPFLAEIKYRIGARKKAKKQHEQIIDPYDPLAREKEATSYLDSEKHGAN